MLSLHEKHLLGEAAHDLDIDAMSHDAVPHGQHFSQDTAAPVSPTAMGSASLAVPLEEPGDAEILAPYP